MILMNDFQAEPEALLQAQLRACERVIRSGWYILGPEVTRFEKLWAETCGAGFAVGVANGMDAIEIGLRSCNIGSGDEVITTSMTAFATVLAILRSGATPVLGDIDPATGHLAPASAERCISPRTKAVLPVHLYGRIANMGDWLDFCTSHRLLLFEDCAQSHLARWKGKTAGTFGTFGACSFYPTKNLGALGDGGALIANDEHFVEMARTLRNYGQTRRYHHPEAGLNSRLDELQAAILFERLEYLNAFTTRRREIAEAYWREIRNPQIQLLSAPATPEQHVNHLFVVLTKTPEKLSQYLKDRDIQSLSHYPIPIHHQRPCTGLKRDPLGLHHAETHAKQCLSIPCHPQMASLEVDKIINALNDYAN